MQFSIFFLQWLMVAAVDEAVMRPWFERCDQNLTHVANDSSITTVQTQEVLLVERVEVCSSTWSKVRTLQSKLLSSSCHAQVYVHKLVGCEGCLDLYIRGQWYQVPRASLVTFDRQEYFRRWYWKLPPSIYRTDGIDVIGQTIDLNSFMKEVWA